MSGGPELEGFSRMVLSGEAPVAGLTLTLEADADVRKTLAKRFDLLSLDSLTARVLVTPWRRTGLQIEGRFAAQVVQACVVSLEPVPAALEDDFTLRYLPMQEGDAVPRDLAIDPLEEELPDALPEEGVDVGEVVAEQLALALDPYPRAPGVVLPTESASEESSEKKANPFEILRNLKDKNG